MEIKTMTEIRAGRMTVSIDASNGSVDETVLTIRVPNEEVRRGPFTEVDQEVAEQLDSANDRIKELDRELANARKAGEIRIKDLNEALDHANEKIATANGDMDRLCRQVKAYDADRHTEQDRANHNRKWARREADRAEDLAAKLDAVTGNLALRDGELVSANEQRDKALADKKFAEVQILDLKRRLDNAETRAKNAADLADGSLRTRIANLMEIQTRMDDQFNRIRQAIEESTVDVRHPHTMFSCLNVIREILAEGPSTPE